MSEITPGGVMVGFWRWAGVTGFGLVLLAALIVGGWQAGWWFTNQDIQRTNHAIQSGYANQTGLLTDFNNAYSAIAGMGPQIAQASGSYRTALVDQRLALANKACSDASQITIAIGPTDRAWVNANCTGSAVSPASTLRKGA